MKRELNMCAKFEHTQNDFGRAQSGFSLIEALVSLIVISVGMIGIAALYGQGLRASGTALYRTQAVSLAADMADRIRANRAATVAYEGAAGDRNCDAGDNNDCAPADMAAHDLWLWQAQVGAQLPGGVGAVSVDTTTPPTYQISVTWQEVGAATPPNYTMTVEIPDV
jgi:type IV pilus assembly protein PilV